MSNKPRNPFTRWLRERKARRVYKRWMYDLPYMPELYEFHGSASDLAAVFARRASGLSDWEPK